MRIDFPSKGQEGDVMTRKSMISAMPSVLLGFGLYLLGWGWPMALEGVGLLLVRIFAGIFLFAGSLILSWPFISKLPILFSKDLLVYITSASLQAGREEQYFLVETVSRIETIGLYDHIIKMELDIGGESIEPFEVHPRLPIRIGRKPKFLMARYDVPYAIAFKGAINHSSYRGYICLETKRTIQVSKEFVIS